MPDFFLGLPPKALPGSTGEEEVDEEEEEEGEKRD